MNPKNQHQLVIYYLLNYSVFTIMDVINDTRFFKLQTRLSEVEQRFGTIATRERKKFINRFGNKSSYNKYSSCVSKEKLIEIFKHYE